MDIETSTMQVDLAIEAREMVRKDSDIEVEGVKVEIEESKDKDITVTKVEILNEKGKKTMGKEMGSYITIESDMMKNGELEEHKEISGILAKQLNTLVNIKKQANILVVGLGNWNVTPDSLGPKTISKIIVTRHLFKYVPDKVDEGLGCVSAFTPGVMGITGMETSEIIKGIVEKTKPDFAVIIDALAARRTTRVNTTIQITNTGVQPGAGVGNKRKKLDEEVLGVPVIVIGVPTVVNAVTLVGDTMDNLLENMKEKVGQSEKSKELYDFFNNLDKKDKDKIMRDLLDPYVENLFVSPKEEDIVIERLTNIISDALNIFLHPGIELEDVDKYIC